MVVLPARDHLLNRFGPDRERVLDESLGAPPPGLPVPARGDEELRDLVVAGVGGQWSVEVDEVAVHVDVVFVHPPAPREAVRVQGVDEEHAPSGRQVGAGYRSEPAGLESRAGEPLDSVRARHDHRGGLGVGGTEPHQVDRQLLSLGSGRGGVPPMADVGTGRGGGGEEAGAGLCVVGSRCLHRAHPVSEPPATSPSSCTSVHDPLEDRRVGLGQHSVTEVEDVSGVARRWRGGRRAPQLRRRPTGARQTAGSRLPCSALRVADAPPGFVERHPPVDADDVGSRRGAAARAARRYRRRSGSAERPGRRCHRRCAAVGCNEPFVRRWAQLPRPSCRRAAPPARLPPPGSAATRGRSRPAAPAARATAAGRRASGPWCGRRCGTARLR